MTWGTGWKGGRRGIGWSTRIFFVSSLDLESVEEPPLGAEEMRNRRDETYQVEWR